MTLPMNVSRCRQRRSPIRATTVPNRRILTVHLEARVALMPSITLVSKPVRIETTLRRNAEFHRSKNRNRVGYARTSITIATRVTAREIQTLPLMPIRRGNGGGSPEGRRRLAPPRAPPCEAMLRPGEPLLASMEPTDAIPQLRSLVGDLGPLTGGRR